MHLHDYWIMQWLPYALELFRTAADSMRWQDITAIAAKADLFAHVALTLSAYVPAASSQWQRGH